MQRWMDADASAPNMASGIVMDYQPINRLVTAPPDQPSPPARAPAHASAPPPPLAHPTRPTNASMTTWRKAAVKGPQ